MRLKHIKLSGFKSFVDPTTITFPGRIIGVVGPNGCGKSNIIDAVRWVMGEMSAKTLRGDHMADVIFNGSSARKPVGKSAVELVFDNSEGKAPGTWSQYAEIAVRRELSRDGQSDYYINRTKCRRRDITDIFLGTGLGPRSYSIIEQGMISRIIEAKPEDLRALVEEAAGVSRYKERRRETENRIRHTRENLTRVEDVLSELDTQLRRLQRQSAAARRYKNLKQEERRLRAQLLAMKWRQLGESIARHDSRLGQLETERESRLAEQREVESRIEHLREEQGSVHEDLSTAQGEYYNVGAEIANVEQRIEHARETRRERREELSRLVAQLEQARSHLEADREALEQARAKLTECEPRLHQAEASWKEAGERLTAAEASWQQWQSRWEEFGREAAEPLQEREIQRARGEELGRYLETLESRRARVREELRQLGEQDGGDAELRRQVQEQDRECEQLEATIAELETRIGALREDIAQQEAELEELRGRDSACQARLASLRELQSAAMGVGDEQVAAWLTAQELARAPRLAARITVDGGWERALDRVLGSRLAGVCVDSIDALAPSLRDGAAGGVCLVESPPGPAPLADGDSLASRCRAPGIDMSALLRGVRTAEGLGNALAMRAHLGDGELVVTREGHLVASRWVELAHDAGSERAGVMAREAEIEQLVKEAEGLSEAVESARAGIAASRERLAELEEEIATRRRELAGGLHRRTELHNRLGREETRLAELESRRERLQRELAEIEAELAETSVQLQRSRERLGAAERTAGDHESRRRELEAERERLRGQLDSARAAAAEARESMHGEQIDHQRLRSTVESMSQGIARQESQLAGMENRVGELQGLLQDDQDPEQAYRAELDRLLERRVEAEQRLAAARQAVSDSEQALRAAEEQRARFAQLAADVQNSIQGVRMERQETEIRRQTLTEQMQAEGQEPEAVIAELPEDADAGAIEEELSGVVGRIERIGPVNLVAIEEFEEQSERKGYLDKQHADLTEALATLEGVMRKIDRETRNRFRETFENLNERFRTYFPKLFGGGNAYLDLQGEDWLDAGVTVMARPPGKRNSTIHLLSGGEKALTAVALLFAFFDLNPAPFCLLDEVDAPLDDNNVTRYCEILRTLSEHTQLIFITHNKITMESAEVLVGVTMAEAGVSRLVSVDVDQAVELAAS